VSRNASRGRGSGCYRQAKKGSGGRNPLEGSELGGKLSQMVQTDTGSMVREREATGFCKAVRMR